MLPDLYALLTYRETPQFTVLPPDIPASDLKPLILQWKSPNLAACSQLMVSHLGGTITAAPPALHSSAGDSRISQVTSYLKFLPPPHALSPSVPTSFLQEPCFLPRTQVVSTFFFSLICLHISLLHSLLKLGTSSSKPFRLDTETTFHYLFLASSFCLSCWILLGLPHCPRPPQLKRQSAKL